MTKELSIARSERYGSVMNPTFSVCGCLWRGKMNYITCISMLIHDLFVIE